MPFTGKATYSAGDTLPEIAEDVADLIAIAAATETPLLDLLGDAARPARSVVHEWLEDAPLPDSDTVVALTLTTAFVVDNPDRFRVYDQLRLEGAAGGEVMRVEAIDDATSTLTVTRGYGGTAVGADPDAGDTLRIIGNAALEGADAGPARFSTRTRKTNVTQIFSSTIEISGSELAVRQAGIASEIDYQKAMRARELLRDLENSIINGVADADTVAGAADAPRTLRGILASIETHRFTPGTAGFPADTALTEEQLNLALRTIWQTAGNGVDTIVVGGKQKRQINAFITAGRRYFNSTESFRDMVGSYESDFGLCRVVLCRHVPAGTVMLLDSSRVGVLPLAGRSFQYKPLARTGDRESGQVLGEYTLEFRNEACHGLITGLAA